MSESRLTFAQDKDKTEKILGALYRNDGYCPCKPDRTEENICPCADMVDNNKCCCGLFVAGEFNEKV